MTDTLVAPYTSNLPSVPSRDRWARQITEAWQSQVSAIFAVGNMLESAKAELRHGEWIAMINSDLPFGRSTANKLMKIAACEYLRNADHGTHLPACWRTLYELTTLSEDRFEHGIATGIINAGMQRKDIRELRGEEPRERRPGLRAQLAEARQEIERLTRMGGNLFDASTPAPEVATVLANINFSSSKVDRIITDWRRKLRERTQQERRDG
jgi:hypothetical protein